jgi:hypothetical protein
MAGTEGIWGWGWGKVQAFAHGYGDGPVTVYAKPRTKRYVLPEGWYPDLVGEERADFEEYMQNSHVVAAAKAVRMWNRATGFAVFQLVDDPKGVDITIHLGDALPGAEGGPTQYALGSGEGSKGGITVNPNTQADRSLLGHELGHTLGLAHPEVTLASVDEAYREYGDVRKLMSGGRTPAKPEIRRVQRLYGDTEVVPQVAGRGPGGPRPQVPSQAPRTLEEQSAQMQKQSAQIQKQSERDERERRKRPSETAATSTAIREG